MIGQMGYSKLVGYGMGGMYFVSFLFFLLLVALIWLVVSKALVNTRKFNMMKDNPMYSGMRMMMKHKEIIECTCDEDDEHEEKTRKVKKK